MNTKANFYYQRRLFLTLVYIIAGVLFTSFPIMGLLKPIQKKEVKQFIGIPTKLEVIDKTDGKQLKRFLNIEIDNKLKKTIIDHTSFKKLEKSVSGLDFVKKDLGKIYKTPIGQVKLNRYLVPRKHIDKVNVIVSYEGELIKQIKVNNTTIIEHEETPKSFFWLFVIIGLLWVLWQIKILITLVKSRPTELYRNYPN